MGGGIGLIAGLTIRRIQKQTDVGEQNLQIVVIAVLMTTGTALLLGGSPILTPMIMGVVLTNSLTRVRSHDVNLSVEAFSAPILIAFFTLAGSELVVAFAHNTDVEFGPILGITAVYIIFRSIGKVYGALLGANLMHSHRNVKKYLGICLLPQAGVALGMAYQAKTDFVGEDGVTVLIVVLIATLVYELFGPIGVKYSLEKAGEIKA